MCSATRRGRSHSLPAGNAEITPQNQECNSCHGNAELFLSAGDVFPEELAANQAVIVEEIPAAK